MNDFININHKMQNLKFLSLEWKTRILKIFTPIEEFFEPMNFISLVWEEASQRK